MTTTFGIILIAFIISAHLFAGLTWERYYKQENEKKLKELNEKNKDGEVVQANAVPMVNNFVYN